jgi:hypothetical protein
MVDKPIDVSSLPPQVPKPPETKSSFPNPFPSISFADADVSQDVFIKKFWETMEKNIGDCINHDMARMKEANEKLKRSLEGKDED